MGLPELWFILVAVLWTGFFVLEGFDFGVGMLHYYIGETETERRVLINTIGPFWDGNEVWLIVAGAGIFAAFPAWYATMFSTFYLALLLVLAALMGRGVTFEYRNKGLSQQWRTVWSWILTVSSLLIPLLVGVAFGDMIHGLPINQNGDYTGNFFQLLTPYALWTGVTLAATCLLHGATFLSLKTTDATRDKSRRIARLLVGPVAALIAIWALWNFLAYPKSAPPIVLELIAVLAILALFQGLEANKDGWAFGGGVVAIGAMVSSLFVQLYPNVMVSSTNSAYNLTVTNTSSAHYALTVMTVVAVIFLPLVLVYQGWNYWVFRQRLSSPPSAGSDQAVVPTLSAGSAPSIPDSSNA